MNLLPTDICKFIVVYVGENRSGINSLMRTSKLWYKLCNKILYLVPINISYAVGKIIKNLGNRKEIAIGYPYNENMECYSGDWTIKYAKDNIKLFIDNGDSRYNSTLIKMPNYSKYTVSVFQEYMKKNESEIPIYMPSFQVWNLLCPYLSVETYIKRLQIVILSEKEMIDHQHKMNNEHKHSHKGRYEDQLKIFISNISDISITVPDDFYYEYFNVSEIEQMEMLVDVLYDKLFNMRKKLEKSSDKLTKLKSSS